MNDQVELPGSVNLDFVEGLYARYVRNPDAVPPEWRRYFQDLANGEPTGDPGLPRPSMTRRGLFGRSRSAGRAPKEPEAEFESMLTLQHRVDRLIRAYRVRGHMRAKIDPLSDFVPYVPQLDPEFYGFTLFDMNRRFACETMDPSRRLTLREIVDRLQAVYCGAVASQFMHIDDLHVRHWLQDRVEGTPFRAELSRRLQLRILKRLTDAIVFEQFLRRKFVGAKSFSLEGAESLIPLLDLAIDKAASQGAREIVVGMAHRGRLNVLANIIGKSPREIFREFEDRDPDLYIGGGDVKYHMGYSNDYRTAGGKHIHLSLCFNPSHLEFVNPVVLGRTRAKQDNLGDRDRVGVMPLLIHGDAAFVGEGVTQETLNLSRLEGYRVGGTVHIVVNNQIGFTTPPSQGRSSSYATSVAKMLPAPIFHVNGEDPEAVARCIDLAMDFRNLFQLDVVIDMYCYRKLGHNEGDEPSFTQPLLYQLISKRRSIRDGYLEHLLKLGEVTVEEADRIADDRYNSLEKHLSEARSENHSTLPSTLTGAWQGYQGGVEPPDDEPKTALHEERLVQLLEALTAVPTDFHVHSKLQKALDQRREMAQGRRPLDWSAAEALALGSVATEGHRIRLTGQDSERGTFSQRHAVLHDVENGQRYSIFSHLDPKQAPVEITNSPLSETGALGFEYGYSLDCPEGLVLWEAQFGDFANAAQVIIDQFIASGEDKWRRLSGLVLLLPHGFEGMGPEHSSARLERFLAIAAEHNIQVIQPSNPAQYFHALRRQALRRWRKPLVVLTPKSMLRSAHAVSTLEDCAHGRFQRVIPDATGLRPRDANRILLCSGKIYYELEARRTEMERNDVAIIRIEQIYPFPRPQIEALLEECTDGTNVIWVQEEPENMGAWRFLRVTVSMEFLGRLPFSGICRPESASPATGSAAAHALEQEQILERAFSGADRAERPRTETIIGTKQLTVE